MLLVEREGFFLPRSRPASGDHAVGKGEPVLACELPRHHHQLLAVEGLVDGLAAFGVDPRPDDVAVLAPVLDMKDDGARLARKAELAFGAVDVVEILLPGELSLRRIGIDREAVEIIAAAGHGMGADLPLGKGAVQVAGDRAAHFRDLDILVVVGVLQMGGEVLPQPALAGLGDHGFRPSALKQAARISVSGADGLLDQGPVGCRPRPEAIAMAWSWSRICARPAENLRDRLMLDGRPAGLARRIAAEDGFGDEGGGGQAGGVDARVELRPQLLGRTVGDGRFAFFVVFRRHAPLKLAIAGLCRSPRRFLAAPRAPPGGSRGALRPPRSMGVRKGEPKSPSGRSRRRNAGRGPGRESPGRGLQGGATVPLLDGSRESRSLPVSRCNGDTVALSREGSMPVSASVRLNNPLARRSQKERASLGIALGGPRGMGNPPAR